MTSQLLQTVCPAIYMAGLAKKIESKYFVFYSNLPQSAVQEFAHFADMFLDLIDRDFIKLKVTRKVNAVVLSTKDEFKRFSVQQLNVSRPSEYGMYLRDKNLFVTYAGSGLGTFTHEIMHFVVELMLPNRPMWAIEGIPEFFEKFYGYEENGKLRLKWGFQNPWRIQALGGSILTLKMADVINKPDGGSEKRLLSVFIYQHGKFKPFLDLIKKGNKRGFPTYVEAAFNKPLNEIEVEWERYLSNIYANRDRIYRLPSSTYFKTEQEYSAFEKANFLAFQN